MPKLVVFRGDSVANEVRLTGRPLRIGRHATNDVVLDDSANGVSRFHAELQSEGGRYFIVDQKSRNGVWMNGRRISGRTPLAIGVPVTIGGFELTLEDDLGSAELDPVPPSVPDISTVVKAGPAARRAERGGASKAERAPWSTDRRQIVMWSSAVALLLLIAVATFVVVRTTMRPPQQEASVPPPPTPIEVPPPPPPPPPDFRQELQQAQGQLDDGDLEGASQTVASVLEQDPDNQDALDLQGRVEEAKALKAKQRVVAAKPPVETEPPDTPGIPRRSGESRDEYQARVRRAQIALADGKASLESSDFVAAINRFRAVEREQPGYQGVDLLIADAQARQKRIVDSDLKGGLDNENAGRFREARLFYKHALRADPSSADARDREAAVRDRTSQDARRLLNLGSTAAKMSDKLMATKYYQQVVELMLEGDPEREQAVKALEALK